MGIEKFRFDGKRALVVGGATGMGAAAVTILKDLGAEVVVMDYADVTAPGVKAIKVDLRDKANTDTAIDQAGGPFDVLLSCAGVADGTPGIDQVNFISHRHMIERMMSEGTIRKGGAIAMISSAAGLGWDGPDYDEVMAYINLPDWEAMSKYFEAHPERSGYGWSKRAMCAYAASKAFEFGKKGVRINAIMPGPTDTPLARANADVWLAFAADYRAELGIPASSPEQQAYPLVFLCSDAADHVSGQNIVIDAGYVSAGFTNTYAAGSFVRMMMGR